MSCQSALRERNRADKLWWKFYFQSFVALNWCFHLVRGMLAMRRSCLLWELIAFAKTVNLNANWSVEITLHTFVRSHDQILSIFGNGILDKEEIAIYLRISLRCTNKDNTFKRNWNSKRHVINKWQYSIIRKKNNDLKKYIYIICVLYIYYFIYYIILEKNFMLYNKNIIIVMRLEMLIVTPPDQLRFKWEVDAKLMQCIYFS